MLLVSDEETFHIFGSRVVKCTKVDLQDINLRLDKEEMLKKVILFSQFKFCSCNNNED